VGDPGGVSQRAEKAGAGAEFLDAHKRPDHDAELQAARQLAEQAREFMDAYDPGALTDAIADEMRAEGLLDGCALADALADELRHELDDPCR
jgi:hypothetical protein